MNNKEILESQLNRILYFFCLLHVNQVIEKNQMRKFMKNEYFFKAVVKKIYFPESFPFIGSCGCDV